MHAERHHRTSISSSTSSTGRKCDPKFKEHHYLEPVLVADTAAKAIWIAIIRNQRRASHREGATGNLVEVTSETPALRNHPHP
jgi:hypothetical protein